MSTHTAGRRIELLVAKTARGRTAGFRCLWSTGGAQASPHASIPLPAIGWILGFIKVSECWRRSIIQDAIRWILGFIKVSECWRRRIIQNASCSCILQL
uniref:Uncharacterized protein n=1 Tax=Oryza barthii TaxID=65489 RepID=A0A0D3EM97_9ORYZ